MIVLWIILYFYITILDYLYTFFLRIQKERDKNSLESWKNFPYVEKIFLEQS